jgi:predicted DNA-binding transcriptional regulator AlpA
MAQFFAFLLDHEMDERVPLARDTRRRGEKAGTFPRRVKLSAKIRAYRVADVVAWESDPEGWIKRNAKAAAE